MLSTVGTRVQRRSLRVASTADREPLARLDCAPELLRWSDFSTPFPPIAPGGYTKYYKKQLGSISSSRPTFCPFLSHWPEPSPSPEPPLRSHLFSDSSSPERLITIIHETSTEPMIPRQTKSLSRSTTTTGTPSSLRRRRRRLLRTPSIERDFALRPRALLSVDIAMSSSGCSTFTSSTIPSLSPDSTSTHASSSDCHSSQSDSNHSSESNHSAYHRSQTASPVTPATSVDSKGFDMLFGVHIDFDGDSGCEGLKDSLVLNVKRPDSRSSFNTARSEFSDLEMP